MGASFWGVFWRIALWVSKKQHKKHAIKKLRKGGRGEDFTAYLQKKMLLLLFYLFLPRFKETL
jgi:hypothetical protein